MITIQKLDIYQKYKGAVEAYIYENGDLPNEGFDENGWTIIDELIGNILLLKSGRASKELELKLKEFIFNETEDSVAMQRVENIAEQKLQSIS